MESKCCKCETTVFSDHAGMETAVDLCPQGHIMCLMCYKAQSIHFEKENLHRECSECFSRLKDLKEDQVNYLDRQAFVLGDCETCKKPMHIWGKRMTFISKRKGKIDLENVSTNTVKKSKQEPFLFFSSRCFSCSDDHVVKQGTFFQKQVQSFEKCSGCSGGSKLSLSVFENWINQCSIDLHKLNQVLVFFETMKIPLSEPQMETVKDAVRVSISSANFNFACHFYLGIRKALENILKEGEDLDAFFYEILCENNHEIFRKWISKKKDIDYFIKVLTFFRSFKVHMDEEMKRLLKFSLKSIIVQNFNKTEFFDKSYMELSGSLMRSMVGEEESQIFWKEVFQTYRTGNPHELFKIDSNLQPPTCNI